MDEIQQGSAEWKQLRLGKVTASRVADVVAKTKSGWAASRANYLAELIAERLTGSPADSFMSSAMQWGTDQEPNARLAYEFMTNETVEQTAFVDHPNIEKTGASPDGLVGADGLIEIKCPNTATHLETLKSQKPAEKYITQMQWQMACTGRKFCDFVSYDPRLPAPIDLFVKRIPRDDTRIAELETMVCEFLTELQSTEDELRSQYGIAEQQEAA